MRGLIGLAILAMAACGGGGDDGPGPMCGDGIVNGDEVCDGADLGTIADCTDLGYYAPGTVGCTAACTLDVSACSGICGDGIVNGPEDCDGADLGAADCTTLGFYEPPGLACDLLCGYDTTACTGYCGDAIVNGPEECDTTAPATACLDAGFYTGTALCTGACALDTTPCTGYCGDNTVNGPEVCDGLDLNGQNCQSQGFATGSLACDPASACATFDVSGCS